MTRIRATFWGNIRLNRLSLLPRASIPPSLRCCFQLLTWSKTLLPFCCVQCLSTFVSSHTHCGWQLCQWDLPSCWSNIKIRWPKLGNLLRGPLQSACSMSSFFDVCCFAARSSMNRELWLHSVPLCHWIIKLLARSLTSTVAHPCISFWLHFFSPKSIFDADAWVLV